MYVRKTEISIKNVMKIVPRIQLTTIYIIQISVWGDKKILNKLFINTFSFEIFLCVYNIVFMAVM